MSFFLLLGTIADAAPTPPPSFGVPNTSSASPGGSPIEIDDCTAGMSEGLLISRSNGSFKIVFTNEGAVVADLVRFQINFGSESIFIRDVGKYSPGVTITHVYKRRGGNVVSSPLLKPAALTCSLIAAHFVDGTEWTPPTEGSAPANVAPPQAIGNGFIAVQLEQTTKGVTVKFALPGGPAQKAGITQGDVIEAVDGQRVATINEAVTMLSASPAGTVLQISISRAGTKIVVPVTVTQRPPATS